ncbi:MAG: flagellar hook-basal body complex protein FliE [Janthinobacterium lividum]
MSVESIGSVGGVSSALGTLATGFGQGIADMDSAQMTRGLGEATGTVTTNPALSAVQNLAASGGTSSVDATSGTDFASMLSGGLDKLQALQSKTDDLAVKAATGDLANVHDYMIASNEVQLATQLTVAVRNKAVDAFNEIMRMQV